MSEIKRRVILTLPLDTLTRLLTGADGETTFTYHPDGGRLTLDMVRSCKVVHVSIDQRRDAIDFLLDCDGVLEDRETRPGSWPMHYAAHITAHITPRITSETRN